MFCHTSQCLLQDVLKILSDSESQFQISKNELHLKLKQPVYKQLFKLCATCQPKR